MTKTKRCEDCEKNSWCGLCQAIVNLHGRMPSSAAEVCPQYARKWCAEKQDFKALAPTTGITEVEI